MRTVELGNGYTLREDGAVFNRVGRRLYEGRNAKGYSQVNIYLNGSGKTFRLARLLAIHLIENPDNLSDVDHIDGDRENNNLSNLRWISHGENIKHSYDMGNRSAKGTNNANSKTTEKDVNWICKMIVSGISSAEISRSVGVTKAIVYNIRHRRHWTHISNHYKW